MYKIILSITVIVVFCNAQLPTDVPEDRLPVYHFCPAGGKTFIEAVMMACPMREKRGAQKPVGRSLRSLFLSQGSDFKKPSYDEFAVICCKEGCRYEDFTLYCYPF